MIKNRRRILKIVALSASAVCAPGSLYASAVNSKSYRWMGHALGADASIEIYADDPKKADRVLKHAETLIRKYEKIFSIYDEASELSRLNREGYLNNPSEEFLTLTKLAKGIHKKTNGAFDVTIQPLWDLYKKHFEVSDDETLAPKIDTVLPLIGSDKIQIDEGGVAFEKAEMAISFNGIAQGFITDRVTDYLKSEGYENILVDLGEYRAGGPQAGGDPWRIGILDPFDGISIADVIEMKGGAIATSSGYGNAFDLFNDQHHHLFNPKTGMSTNLYASVSVLAQNAAIADALSTAFTNMTVSQIKAYVASNNIKMVHIINHDGQIAIISA